jgi:hypothetical protein
MKTGITGIFQLVLRWDTGWTVGIRLQAGARDFSLLHPRGGLDDVEKRKFLTLPGLELRPLGSPARSQSLYRLSYPGSLFMLLTKRKIFELAPAMI